MAKNHTQKRLEAIIENKMEGKIDLAKLWQEDQELDPKKINKLLKDGQQH